MNVICFTITGYAAKKTEGSDQEHFEVDVKYGYNGYIKSGSSNPVTVTVTNKKSDFEGRVKLIVETDYDTEQVAYMKELIIPAGSEKQISFVTPSLQGLYYVQLFIEDSKENAVFYKRFPITATTINDIYVGMLTDDYNSLNYYDDISLVDLYTGSGKELKLVNLSASQISENSGGLDTFDILVINNFDTSILTDEQYDSLKGWVDRGGILLIGTGSTYQKTLSKFQDDYITGTIGNLNKVTRNFRPNEDMFYYRYEPITYDALDIVVDGSKRNDNLACQLIEKGAGKIVIFDYDMGSSQFSDWDGNSETIYYLLEEIMNYEVWQNIAGQGNNQLGYWSLQRMISNTFLGSIPSIGLYVLLIVIYIILLPILYLILKIKDKRHFMWIGVPLLSLAFVLLIFGLGTGTRQSKPFLNYSAIINSKSDRVSETTYFSATSPKNKAYQFAIGRNYIVNPVETYSYYSNRGDETPKVGYYTIGLERKGTSTEVEIRNLSAFETKYFEATKEHPDFGDVEINIYYTGTEYVGTITNHTEYDLTNAGLIVANMSTMLEFGTIPKGETINLEDIAGQSGIPYYDMPSLLIPYDYSDSDYESAKKSAKRNFLSEYLYTVNQDYSTRYFVAFMDDYVSEIGENTEMEVSGNTLFIKEADINYTYNGQTNIPDISAFIYTQQGDFYNYDYDYTYMNSSEGTIEYQLEENIKVEKITLSEYSEVGISFYNFKTGGYEIVFSDNDILEEDLERFFDEKNRLFVRLTKTVDYETRIPIFSVTGREK